MTAKITDDVRAVAALRPDPKNARRHNEAQITQIVNSLERFGYIPNVAIRPDGMIISGHATVEALKRTRTDALKVNVIEGLTEKQYAALALALNRIPENSTWDQGVLREVLGEIGEEEDLTDIGFGTEEIDRILAGDGDIEVKEIATGDVEDEFWISLRGPLKHQAAVLRALQEAMKPFDGVEVDLGTIPVEA